MQSLAHSHLKSLAAHCINLGDGNTLLDEPSKPEPNSPPRGATLVAAGLLLAALALVVLYTSQRAFLSPVALVVVAAIGMAGARARITSTSVRNPSAPIGGSGLSFELVA